MKIMCLNGVEVIKMKKRKENRLTIVEDGKGRVYEIWNVEITESIQDEGRTLKLFIKRLEK